MRTLDPDLLRTLVAFEETGSLARAARAVNRTPSAVTAQMQRLEADLGVGLLAPEGRGRVLTEAGRRLAAHGRRILAAHRDAWLEVTGAAAAGVVRLGVTQDFAEAELPGLLAAFAASHPLVRLDLRVGRSVELATALAEDGLDVALLVDGVPGGETVAAFAEPMVWLSARDGWRAPPNGELPVALLDAPCGFRDATLAALDGAGVRYRIAATSASLAGIKAAVRAGLAVTARTQRWADDAIAPVPDRARLPALPEVRYAIRARSLAEPPALNLAALLRDGLVGMNAVPDDA